jgi:hypothetical protein
MCFVCDVSSSQQCRGLLAHKVIGARAARHNHYACDIDSAGGEHGGGPARRRTLPPVASSLVENRSSDRLRIWGRPSVMGSFWEQKILTLSGSKHMAWVSSRPPPF